MMYKTLNFCYLNPLPNLPPQGKEPLAKPFPLGGNGKGGQVNYGYNLCFIQTLL